MMIIICLNVDVIKCTIKTGGNVPKQQCSAAAVLIVYNQPIFISTDILCDNRGNWGNKFDKDVHVAAFCLKVSVIVMPAQMPAVLFHILSIHNQANSLLVTVQGAK